VPYVYDKLSPLELLRFAGKLYGMEASAIRAKSEELLKFFSLWDVRDVLIEEFSHGMKQKAILSAALLHSPKILILDEPMVGLDPVSIKSFKDFLKDQSRKGLTVVFSTHTLSTAEELADRIAIINQGQLAAIGTLDELRTQFKSHGNLESMFMKLVEQK
jgi:ABC-2 type transport system ATP-binding protein